MSWELRKVRKDGTVLWVRDTAQAVRNDKEKPVVLIVCEDITLVKAAGDITGERRVQRTKSSGVALTVSRFWIGRDASGT